jgi:hypothetical protein
MPDLKTALSTALSSWEQDDQKIQQEKKVRTLPQQFMPTNNVTQETFNYVKNNPNKTSGEVCDALEARGFKRNSVGSLLTQFLKQSQMIRDFKGRFSTTVPNYTPLKSTRQFKAAGKRTSKIVQIKSKPKSAGIAALHVDNTTQTAFSVTPWSTDGIISKLSVIQARALYDELKKIFGG